MKGCKSGGKNSRIRKNGRWFRELISMVPGIPALLSAGSGKKHYLYESKLAQCLKRFCMDTENLLVDYFSQYMTLSREEIQLIKDEDIIRKYEKHEVLLEEGQIAQACFLVLKGCVKRYYIEDGEEKIVEFYTENDPIAPVSYTTKEPSLYYLSCVEPSIISSGTTEKTQQFLQKFPRFIPIFVSIGDDLSAKKQIFLDDLKNLPPEIRYQKLLETRPDLVNRVPQYMIASYLGIQPESLSRIRKRIWSNKNGR